MSHKPPKTQRDQIIESFLSKATTRAGLTIPLTFQTDLQGKVISISQTSKVFIQQQWNMNLEEGDDCFKLLPTENLSTFVDALSLVIKYGVPETFSISFKGSSYTFFLTPLFCKEGILNKIQILISPAQNLKCKSNISSQLKVEEATRIAKERYALISKVTREAVYDWDMTNNIMDWSDSYYEIYGYDRVSARESLLQWVQQIHKEDRERVVNKMNAAINNKNDYEWNCEYKLIQADRKIAVVLERGYIIRDEKGKAIRMIGSLQDITTLKQNERALEELYYVLKKHSAELAQSNAELEQFAYIASHDLQEPLRMVTSFLSLLEKKYKDKLDDKGREYIHFATDGSYRMRQIILDLLDYSRVGKLNYNIELVDINAMVKNIIQLYENLIEEKTAQIEFGNLPVIKAANTPLQRVLSNLISNSIKYSRENVPPIIKFSVKDIGSHWEFMVNDNGIGIDERFKEKIFILFQRLHSRDEYSGTGIGLAISKKIVENHGGKIWVESIVGKGSTFHFTIQKHF